MTGWRSRRRLWITASLVLAIIAATVGVVVIRGHSKPPITSSALGQQCDECTPNPERTPTPSPTGTPHPTPTGSGGGLAGMVTTCGTQFCVGGHPVFLNGASVYNPGLRPAQSGILNPGGTVVLAEAAHLNTIRVINFYSKKADPNIEPYTEVNWVRVDQMIAAARNAGLHIDLGLGDYRNILWQSCIDPFTYDWTHFINFVANRVNTVTGVVYKHDPTISFVSIAGEPLQPNKPHTGVNSTGSSDSALANCTIQYSTQQLTDFYRATLNEWSATGATVMINTGGLGYINEYKGGGIDWHTIFALPNNAFCDIKTYGGMYNFAATVATYCHSINKPLFDEEFGWKQGMGDTQRAALFTATYKLFRSIGGAGFAFWNLGYQVGTGSYEVSPLTPVTFAAVQSAGL
jgi:hypothetical protein